MKLIKNLNIALICVILLLFGGCQKCKKEVCPAPTSAKFKMYQPLDYTEYNADTKTYTPKTYIVDEDVFLMEGTITFEAEDTTALSYEWKIGDDDRVFTTKKFSLRFKENDLGAVRQLDIRLIIKKTPASCNASDNGVDTLIRKVNFINSRTEPEKWAIMGKYLGYNEDEPNKKFTIEIKREPRTRTPFGFTDFIVGLLQGCLSTGEAMYIPIGYANNTSFRFESEEIRNDLGLYYNCRCANSGLNFGYLSEDKQKIIIQYVYYNIDRIVLPYPIVLTKRKFIGVRTL